MSASRPVLALETDRGPPLRLRDFTSTRKRQPIKSKSKKKKKRRSHDSDGEEMKDGGGSDEEEEEEEDEDARYGNVLGHIPGMSSVKRARIAAELPAFNSHMDVDDWDDELKRAGLGPAPKRSDPRTVRSSDNTHAQDQVDEWMRDGDHDAVMDAYLQERAARKAMDQQQADRDAAMEDVESSSKEEDAVEFGDDLFARMRELALDERVEAVARQRLYTRVHLATDKLVGADIRQGDLRLAKIRKCLTEMGYTRSQFQELFHNKFIQACLPQIYGAEWPECCERVLEEFGIKRINYEVLIQTPRRLGKTISVAMFVCCMLLCCPEIRICVFSTGKRASSAIMLEVIKIITYMGHANRIVKKNCEQVKCNGMGGRVWGIGPNGDATLMFALLSRVCVVVHRRRGARCQHGIGEGPVAIRRVPGCPPLQLPRRNIRYVWTPTQTRGGGGGGGIVSVCVCMCRLHMLPFTRPPP